MRVRFLFLLYFVEQRNKEKKLGGVVGSPSSSHRHTPACGEFELGRVALMQSEMCVYFSDLYFRYGSVSQKSLVDPGTFVLKD